MKTYELGWARVVDGKWDEAVEWSRELDDYFESKGWYPGYLLEPMKEDKSGEMAWVFEFESPAAYEEWYGTIHADAGVKERLSRMGDLFVAGTARFTAYKLVY